MTNKIPHPLSDDIASLIFLLRGQRVMLDIDLARLYGVSTKRLKEQVRRNLERFPSDFMYLLTKTETLNLRSHFATSRWGGSRYRSFAFTEQGVAMLSSVLKSKQAIQMNIRIMRAFVKCKELLLAHKELARKLEKLERGLGKHDEEIRTIFAAIRQLMTPPERPKRQIGFHP